jgi:hypothetical protein
MQMANDFDSLLNRFSAEKTKVGPSKDGGGQFPRGGNPNHDPETGRFTTSPAESGDALRSSPKAIAAANYAQSHAHASSGGKCYTFVKRALLATKISTHYLTGVAAQDAGPNLEALGYKNVLGVGKFKSPYDAPTGAIIVYKATKDAHLNPNDHGWQYGHIEFRTEKGFASDYFSQRARTGDASNGMTGKFRTVIGIYVKK